MFVREAARDQGKVQTETGATHVMKRNPCREGWMAMEKSDAPFTEERVNLINIGKYLDFLDGASSLTAKRKEPTSEPCL